MRLLRWLFHKRRKEFDGRLLFFDESGVNLSMTRGFARAPRGERAVGSTPKNWGDSVTLAAGIGLHGLFAPLMLHGAMNGEIFEAYIEQFVLPHLVPGDVVLMDNLGAHRRNRVRTLLESVGAELVLIPPYSPDLNPIELAWSKVKTLIRGMAPRTYEALEDAIVEAFSAITTTDVVGWFRHAGY